ncbi:MAG: outer membrane protein transport protein [Elusimicrobia bacterium]|nr:outer membrane protein transport protein [Candidatus Obscuribacterium magneticum]
MQLLNRSFLAVAVVAFYSLPAFALGSGAFANQAGVSTKATAHGYAFAGVADDPSAIFYNPAGLAQVKGWQIMVGGSILALKTEHITPTGIKDKTASNLPIAPYFYLTGAPSNSPWTFGIGVNSPFGLVTEWKNDSFSSYWATKSQVYMYAVNPTAAYALSEKLSLGAGVDYFNIYNVELNQRVPGLPASPEGDGKFSGDGAGWGYNFGALWKPVEKHSFGLSYRSKVNVKVKGDTELSGVTGALSLLYLGGASSYKTGASTKMKFPQSLLLGYGFHPNSKWTVFADYEWFNWSRNKETKFDYDQNNALLTQSVPREWRNSNNVGVGTEWKAKDWLDLRCGALVYEAVVPSKTLESSLPDSSRFDLTIGVGFHLGNSNIDFAYNSIFFNNRNIDNNAGNSFSSMDGKFKTMINIFSVGLSHKWG